MTDLISRADAIDAVVSWTVEDRPHEVMPTDLVDRIKALPSADAAQGEWQPSSIKSDMWHCSVCGSPLMTDDINETHFCPNCGARMKGGAE